MRLIDADVLIKDITESVIEVSGDSGLAEEAVKCYQAVILKYIGTMPTPEDCRPHGRWISDEGDVLFHCSECETQISTSWDYEDLNWNYCPNCGAVMDGKEQGDENT